MKAVIKAIIVLGSLLGSQLAWGRSDEQAYLDSCRRETGVPVPIAVVSPIVGPEYNGAVVKLEFVVDERGRPVDLAVKSSPDDRLAATVLDAVKQWRFKPAERDGSPVEARVALPVKIVDAPIEYIRIAAQ